MIIGIYLIDIAVTITSFFLQATFDYFRFLNKMFYDGFNRKKYVKWDDLTHATRRLDGTTRSFLQSISYLFIFKGESPGGSLWNEKNINFLVDYE